jgi:formylglycine-generating enzyme required for sulfatase activity
MVLEGPARDDSGRQFVVRTTPKDRSLAYPPDLLVVDPEEQVIGRLDFNATAEETIDFLRDALARRPELAPTEDPLAKLDTDLEPPQVEMRDLEARFEAEERVTLIEPLERWLNEYRTRYPDDAAVAGTLLGAARYHAGDFEGAHQAWAEVVLEHPKHPIRHRAWFNMLDVEAWPAGRHVDVLGAPPPGPEFRRPVVPDPQIREENLRVVATDPRYVKLAGVPFVTIPAGTFSMGGPAFRREKPIRRVTLSRPILMAAWPVSRAEWNRFRPDAWPGIESEGLAGEIPATTITYTEAIAYCEWLSVREGRRFRLATEAEWEYAARGGIEGAMYPWGDDPIDASRANYGLPRPVPNGSYPPNGYGLFEMVANVMEWTSDIWAEDAYAQTPLEVTDPRGPEACDRHYVARVLRGGFVGAEMCHIMSRNSWRYGFAEEIAGLAMGFRLVTDID